MLEQPNAAGVRQEVEDRLAAVVVDYLDPTIPCQ